MAILVKITADNDGSKKKYAKWCLSVATNGVSESVCTGEVYGIGASNRVLYKTKEGSIKKVTCPECISVIKWFKDLK